MAFGLEHPACYSVLFSAQRPACGWPEPVPIGPDGGPISIGAGTFALLVQAIQDCVTAGVSASADAVADATAVWVALHGTVGLRTRYRASRGHPACAACAAARPSDRLPSTAAS